MRAVLPAQIPIDTFEGRAWIAITPFAVRGLRTRLAPPLAGLSSFPEVNVRTYATIDDWPGVVFFSLDAASRLGVAAARRTYRLPYHRWDGSLRREGGRQRFAGRRLGGPPAALDVAYAPAGEIFEARPGTFEHFATERYCLYTDDRARGVLRAEIHHPPWPLQPAVAEWRENAMTEQIGVALDGDPRLHYARRQDVVFWLVERVAGRV